MVVVVEGRGAVGGGRAVLRRARTILLLRTLLTVNTRRRMRRRKGIRCSCSVAHVVAARRRLCTRVRWSWDIRCWRSMPLRYVLWRGPSHSEPKHSTSHS